LTHATGGLGGTRPFPHRDIPKAASGRSCSTVRLYDDDPLPIAVEEGQGREVDLRVAGSSSVQLGPPALPAGRGQDLHVWVLAGTTRRGRKWSRRERGDLGARRGRPFRESYVPFTVQERSAVFPSADRVQTRSEGGFATLSTRSVKLPEGVGGPVRADGELAPPGSWAVTRSRLKAWGA